MFYPLGSQPTLFTLPADFSQDILLLETTDFFSSFHNQDTT